MEEKVYEVFKKLNIEYEVISHPAIFKAKDRENIEIDFKDSVCCKNLLLKDKKNFKLYLVCLPVVKRANLKVIKNELNSNSLTFATDDELIENLGIKSGNASILNIIEKPDTKVKFVIDKELLNLSKVAFHPNVNTASVSFSPDKIESILNYYNADYVFANV